jgi:hypothetical protein
VPLDKEALSKRFRYEAHTVFTVAVITPGLSTCPDASTLTMFRRQPPIGFDQRIGGRTVDVGHTGFVHALNKRLRRLSFPALRSTYEVFVSHAAVARLDYPVHVQGYESTRFASEVLTRSISI